VSAQPSATSGSPSATWLTERRLRRLILFSLVACIGAIGVAEFFAVRAFQPLGVDYLPLWTGARSVHAEPHALYDFDRITALQAWRLDEWLARIGPRLRPFVYPPSALLVLAPVSLASFQASYLVWIAATLGLMLTAAALLERRSGLQMAVLAGCATPCFTCAYVGQSTFLVAGLVALAAPQLRSRPAWAGALLAAAALVKPTLLLLAPVALIANRQPRALASALIVGLAGAGATALLFGPALWLDWLAALPRFQTLADATLGASTVSISAEAATLGLQGPALLALRAVVLVAGAALVWRAFSRSEDLVVRLAALCGAGLICAPYALRYDVVMLVPAVALFVTRTVDTKAWTQGIGAMLLLMFTGVLNAGAFAATALVLLLTHEVLIRRPEAPTALPQPV
jgi:hypothetical protein